MTVYYAWRDYLEWVNVEATVSPTYEVTIGTDTDVKLLSQHTTGVALDPAGGKVYWIRYQENEIRRSNLDGTAPETFESAGTDIRHVRVDQDIETGSGMIYWSSVRSAVAGIHYRPADQSVPAETLVELDGDPPRAFALKTTDPKTVFWFEPEDGTSTYALWRAAIPDPPGPVEPELVSSSLIDPTDLAYDESWLYMILDETHVYRIPYYMDNARADCAFTVPNPFGGAWHEVKDLALDLAGGSVYWTVWGDDPVRDDDSMRVYHSTLRNAHQADLLGSGTTAVIPAYSTSHGIAIMPTN
jgi:hypothetical protein